MRDEEPVMTRAAKEPTEDVKRAFRQAIEFTGIQVWKIQVVKMPERDGR